MSACTSLGHGMRYGEYRAVHDSFDIFDEEGEVCISFSQNHTHGGVFGKQAKRQWYDFSPKQSLTHILQKTGLGSINTFYGIP